MACTTAGNVAASQNPAGQRVAGKNEEGVRCWKAAPVASAQRASAARRGPRSRQLFLAYLTPPGGQGRATMSHEGPTFRTGPTRANPGPGLALFGPTVNAFFSL